MSKIASPETSEFVVCWLLSKSIDHVGCSSGSSSSGSGADKQSVSGFFFRCSVYYVFVLAYGRAVDVSFVCRTCVVQT